MEKTRTFLRALPLLMWLSPVCAASQLSDPTITEVDLGLTGGPLVFGNWETKGSLAAAKFTDAAVGDELVCEITAVSAANDYPQIRVDKGSGSGTLAGTDSHQLKGKTASPSAPYQAVFWLNAAAVAELQAGGCKFEGGAFTLSAVKLRQNHFDAAKLGFIGTTLYVCDEAIDWNPGPSNNSVILAASLFANVEVGQTLRFYTPITASGAGFNVVGGDWEALEEGDEAVTLTTDYYDRKVTAALLTKLKAGGCIVMGTNYTLKGVSVLTDDQLPKLSLEIDKSSVACYTSGSGIKVKVNVSGTSKQPMATVTVSLTVKDDALGALTGTLATALTENVEMGPSVTKTAEFSLPALQPGFYHLSAAGGGVSAKSYVIGVQPEQVTAAADAQEDFDTYWAAALKQLAAVKPEYKLTELTDKSNSQRKVYLVEMKSVPNGTSGDAETIHCYWCVPQGVEHFPAFITYQGYDNGTAPDNIPSGSTNPTWGELVVSTRGQMTNARPPYANTYDDYFSYEFGDQDKYYYRGAFLDAVRAIDFVLSQPGVEKRNVFANGVSQGGALTYAATALDPDKRLNAIAVGVSFLGDFPNYFQVASWPGATAKSLAAKKNMTDEQMYAFLSYYDTKNLTGKITCPVRARMGMQDPVCPPRTNFAAYNNLGSTEKEYVVNPFCEHDPGDDWWWVAPPAETVALDWFTKHLVKDSEVVTDALCIQKATTTTRPSGLFDLCGRPLATPPAKGIYIENGRLRSYKP